MLTQDSPRRAHTETHTETHSETHSETQSETHSETHTETHTEAYTHKQRFIFLKLKSDSFCFKFQVSSRHSDRTVYKVTTATRFLGCRVMVSMAAERVNERKW